MMKLTFLLLLATIANTTAASNRPRRFLHADWCDIKEHPSIVSITIMQTDTRKPKYRFGTGNLITMKWILTYNLVFDAGNYSNAKVVAGTNYELPIGTDEFRTIERIVKHEGLVLCELNKPFVQNDRIQPAKLTATIGGFFHCKELMSVGWGTSSDNSYKKLDEFKEAYARGDRLRCAEAKEARCDSYYADDFCYILIDRIAEQCRRDYGLGVFCNDILVGVSSGLTSGSRDECNSTGISRSSDLFHYISWLMETTGIPTPTPPEETTTPSTPESISLTTGEYTNRYTGMIFNSPTTTEEEDHSEISNGQHIEANHSVFLLLICLLLFY